MPEETMVAFANHGQVKKNSVEENIVGAAQTMAELERLGIDFRCVAWQLKNEGVQKFIIPLPS
jgi:transaldolase